MKARLFKRVTALFCLTVLLAVILTACGKETIVDESVESTYISGTAQSAGSGQDSQEPGNTMATGGQNSGTPGTTGKNGQTATTVTNKTTKVPTSVRPEINLKNYKFTIMSPWLMRSEKDAVTEYEKTFWAKINGIQKEYGCTISIVGGNLPTIDHVRAQIMSGSKVADLVHVKAEELLGLAAAGYITPWNSVKDIDVTSGKWVPSYTKLGTIDKNVYGLNWMRAPEARMCVIVNKTLLKNSGVNDNLYSLVNAKQWTWSKMQDMAKQVVKKYTSNGRTTAWGVGGWYQEVARALWVSNGASLVTYNGDTAKAGYNSARMTEAINFMHSLVNTDKVVDAANYRNSQSFNSTDNGDSRSAFLDGKLAFMFEETWFINQYLKPSNPNFEYGMLPVPIGPSEKNYRTDAGTAGVFVCTSTNAESDTLDKTTAILNLLAEPEPGYEDESWWEYDLKREYFQNDSANDDLAMYKLCLNTAVSDYGVTVNTLYNQFDRTVLQGSVYFNEATVSSAIQSLGTTYDKAIQSMFTFKN